MRFIDHIDVHQSASDSDTVEGIRQYHTVTKGWGEIAYNELIDRDGNLVFGKSDEQYPFSTGSFERDGTGWAICLLGKFEGDTVLPSPAQWTTLIRRLKEKAAQYNTTDIKGHRERYANSECPGFSDAVLDRMRAEVFSGQPIIQEDDDMRVPIPTKPTNDGCKAVISFVCNKESEAAVDILPEKVCNVSIFNDVGLQIGTTFVAPVKGAKWSQEYVGKITVRCSDPDAVIFYSERRR